MLGADYCKEGLFDWVMIRDILGFRVIAGAGTSAT